MLLHNINVTSWLHNMGLICTKEKLAKSEDAAAMLCSVYSLQVHFFRKAAVYLHFFISMCADVKRSNG